jgi:hypothetical protein
MPRKWIEKNYKKIKDRTLHTKARKGCPNPNLTRRDVTESRISNNIIAFNQPTKK